jgi:hypothetical protein
VSTPKRNPRRGSEVRRRNHQVAVRLDQAEHDELMLTAQAAGMKPATLLRERGLCRIGNPPGEAERSWAEVRAEVIKALVSAAGDFGAETITATPEAFADAVLAVFDEEAANRMAGQLVAECRFRAMEIRDGRIVLEMSAAREIAAMWTGAARAMLENAENYSETAMTFTDKGPGPHRKYAFTVQKVGRLTPHQARQRAEARADRLAAASRAVLAAFDASDDAALKSAAESLRAVAS